MADLCQILKILVFELYSITDNILDVCDVIYQLKSGPFSPDLEWLSMSHE